MNPLSGSYFRCKHGTYRSTTPCRHFDVRKAHTYPPWFFHSARVKERIDFIVIHSFPLWFDTYMFNKTVHNLSSLPIPKSVRKYLGFGTKFIPKHPF